MSEKGLRRWELDFVLIAATQIFVHPRCFKVFWSKMAEKSTLWAIPKSPPPPLERGCAFGSLSEKPLPKEGGLKKGLPPPHPTFIFPPTRKADTWFRLQ